MKVESRIDIIKSPLFLLGLAILLLNDFYFKYEYHNELTGKLSDLSGLFIFPFFFSTLVPRWSRGIYLITAGLFIFWSSELSQSFINYWNHMGIGINRTVDYTDFLALFILPFSFNYFNSELDRPKAQNKFVIKVLMVISVFSFCATTQPREYVNLQIDTNRSFLIEMSKSDFFNSLKSGHGYSKPLQKNLTDSLFYLYFDITELNTHVTGLAHIQTSDSINVTVHLDSILVSEVTGRFFSGINQDNVNKLKSLNSKDFEKYFETNFIEVINKNTDLYYDNKQIHDNWNAE